MTEKEKKKSEGRAMYASRSAPLKARPRSPDPEDSDKEQ
jgi:hypothetical protein